MAKTRLLMAVAAAGLVSTHVSAQTVAPDKAPPGTNAPSQFDSQQPQRNGESLSDRLERSGGVIKPPEHADKDIHMTPPPTGDNMNLPPSALPPNKNPGEKEATPK